MPADTAPGLASFELKIAGAVVASATAAVASAAPGIFIADPLDPARPAAGSTGPVTPGDVLRLYATGLTSDTPRVFFGAEQAQVLASQPLTPGLWGIDVAVPTAIAQVPVFLTLGNAASNGVTVTVKH